MAKKRITLYERDGAVYRRVEKDLGRGQRVVTGDSEVHPDIDEFLEENPTARVVRETDGGRIANPEAYTLKNLPDFLSSVDSVDEVLDMMRRDSRVSADSIYLERIEELVDDAAGDDEAEEEELPELVEEELAEADDE